MIHGFVVGLLTGSFPGMVIAIWNVIRYSYLADNWLDKSLVGVSMLYVGLWWLGFFCRRSLEMNTKHTLIAITIISLLSVVAVWLIVVSIVVGR